MKIIHKYIFTEITKIFLISTLFLTMMLFLDKVLFLTELIISRGVTFIEVLKMMLFISPAFLAITIPISVLLGAVVTFNQLSVDNELVVMKSCGWSFMNLMRPVLLFSFVAYLITNSIIFYLIPLGNESFKKMIFEIIQTRANIDIKPHVFNREFKDMVLYVNDKKDNAHFSGIFIADTSSSGSSKIILSEEGVIVSDPAALKIQLQLKSGTIHDKSKEGTHYQLIKFDRYDLTLDLPSSSQLEKKGILKTRELSLGALLKKIRDLKASGATAYYEEVELSKKFSLPFTCLLFGLIGAPLGIRSSRSGKSGGFLMAILVIMLYYIGMVTAQNFGKSGEINPLLSVWIPNFILMILAIYLSYKTQKETPFSILDRFIRLIISVKNLLTRGILKKI
ncbi:MAG: LPS export ABC transporter permease LptF [Nitrospina sp.]|nr:MAG: LPS export ABC transporter permease LptF [Nitrospina sp.]